MRFPSFVPSSPRPWQPSVSNAWKKIPIFLEGAKVAKDKTSAQRCFSFQHPKPPKTHIFPFESVINSFHVMESTKYFCSPVYLSVVSLHHEARLSCEKLVQLEWFLWFHLTQMFQHQKFCLVQNVSTCLYHPNSTGVFPKPC